VKVILRFLALIWEEDGAVMQVVLRTPWGCFMVYLLDRNNKRRICPYHFDCVYGIELWPIELRWVGNGLSWLWKPEEARQ
jgi:hypothetical protein